MSDWSYLVTSSHFNFENKDQVNENYHNWDKWDENRPYTSTYNYTIANKQCYSYNQLIDIIRNLSNKLNFLLGDEDDIEDIAEALMFYARLLRDTKPGQYVSIMMK
jgi:hypothetical protein